jgi:hypothetical protein
VAQALTELLGQETVPASALVRARVRGQWGEERGGAPEVFVPLLELSSYDGLLEEVRI